MVEPPCGKIAGSRMPSDCLPRASRLDQGAHSHLAGDARKAQVVHAVVGEEALVFGGEDRLRTTGGISS